MNRLLKSFRSIGLSIATLLLVVTALNGQDVKVGLMTNDDGRELIAYLISEPQCNGQGISQASLTIRWEKGTAAPSKDATVFLDKMNISCGRGGDDFPESNNFDYLFCSIEPSPNSNIEVDFQSGQAIPFFSMSLDAVGTWMLEDLDGDTVIPGNDTTKPYVNIQNSPCNTAASDNRNYFQIDGANGMSGNELSYDVQSVSNAGLEVNSENEKPKSTGFHLRQAYPNPFVDKAQLTYLAPKTEQVSIDLFDTSGVVVQNIFSGTIASGQERSFSIEGEDLSSGTYFYRAESDSFVGKSRSITLLR